MKFVIVCGEDPYEVYLLPNESTTIMWPQWEWCNVGLYHGHNYENCIWIMHSKYDVNFTVTIKDNQLDATQTLLLVGSGERVNRIFNGVTAKAGSWFSVKTSAIWIQMQRYKCLHVDEKPPLHLQIEVTENGKVMHSPNFL